MWRKFLVAGISAVITLIIMTTFAFAETPQSVVTMQGQATGFPGTRATQMRLVSKSNDAQGWLLNIVLNSQGFGREREVEDEGTHGSSASNVKGSFTLSTQQQLLSSGTFTGWLNSNGTGDIRLSDPNGLTSLDMSFSIAQSGSVNATVQGQWPRIPTLVVPNPSVSNPTTTTTTVTAAKIFDPVTVVPSTPEQPADPLQPVNHFYWYLSRTSALAAYILLFINICMGVGLKSKYLDLLWGRWRTFDLHQFTAILGGSLVILHIFSLLGDSYFKFTFYELLVPTESPYRPFWTAMGIIGFYAGALLVVSFYIRRIIRQKIWRILHYMSYILFFVILFHGIKTGTDTAITWVQWLYISTGTMVSFLFLLRLFSYNHPQPDSRRIPAKVESSSSGFCGPKKYLDSTESPLFTDSRKYKRCSLGK